MYARWTQGSSWMPQLHIMLPLLLALFMIDLQFIFLADVSYALELPPGSMSVTREESEESGTKQTQTQRVRSILATLQQTKSCILCDLSSVDLSTAALAGADLHGAALSHANLFQVQLSGANLRGAKFDASILDEAALDGADLSGADLRQALVRRTLLLGARLDANISIDGADFSGALIDRTNQRLLCELAQGVNSRTGVATATSLACPEPKTNQSP